MSPGARADLDTAHPGNGAREPAPGPGSEDAPAGFLARLLAQSATAGTATGLRLPGSRAPAVAATMAADPSQT